MPSCRVELFGEEGGASAARRSVGIDTWRLRRSGIHQDSPPKIRELRRRFEAGEPLRPAVGQPGRRRTAATNGQAGTLTSLTLPADATVVYDTAVNAVVEIRVTQSMTPAGPTPAGTAPPLPIAPFDAAEAKEHQEAWAKYLGVTVETTNSIGMKFVLIPPGEFWMGSPETEDGRGTNELRHRVQITRPFSLAVYETTQADYERVTGINPSYFSTGGRGQGELSGTADTSRFPVELAPWGDAEAFCERLSSLSKERATGHLYRLPTEAEWEYACRALLAAYRNYRGMRHYLYRPVASRPFR